MTPKEKLELFERVANAFELAPHLGGALSYVSYDLPRCFCAIGAAAALDGAMVRGSSLRDLIEDAEEWARTNLSDDEIETMAMAHDYIPQDRRPESIRRAARKLWGTGESTELSVSEIRFRLASKIARSYE